MVNHTWKASAKFGQCGFVPNFSGSDGAANLHGRLLCFFGRFLRKRSAKFELHTFEQPSVFTIGKSSMSRGSHLIYAEEPQHVACRAVMSWVFGNRRARYCKRRFCLEMLISVIFIRRQTFCSDGHQANPFARNKIQGLVHIGDLVKSHLSPVGLR